jgi:hypothetical protein
MGNTFAAISVTKPLSAGILCAPTNKKNLLTETDMIHELPLVQELFTLLNDQSIKFAVCGGYPRDIKHGVKPNDLDIVIYGFNPEDKSALASFEVLYNFLIEHDLLLQQPTPNFELPAKKEASDYDADDRVLEVVKLNCHVDLIVMIPSYESLKEVISTFDFNINQYVFSISRGYTTFLGENEGTLRYTRDFDLEHMDRREAHIKAKAVSFGWDVSQCVKPEEFAIEHDDDEYNAVKPLTNLMAGKAVGYASDESDEYPEEDTKTWLEKSLEDL